MLKQAQPGKVRRLGGAVLMALIIPLGIGAAYAATSPAPLPGTGSGLSHASEYQLAMKIELADGNDAHGKVRRLSIAICQAPEQAARVSSKTMAVETIVTPLHDNRVRIATTISDAAGHRVAQPVLIGALGNPVRVAVDGANARPRYTLDITPVAGCPARSAKSRQ